MTPEELQAFYDATQAALKAEGFTTVDALSSDRNKALAEAIKAKEARDKFSAQVEAANELVRSRGGEVGTKQVEIDQLTAEKAQLEKDLTEARAGIVPAGGDPAPKPDEKTPAEQLLVLETQMTDAHWDHVDSILGDMTVEDASEAAKPTQIRLDIIKGALNDPDLNKAVKPTSLRPAAAGAPDPEENAYAKYTKKKTPTGGRGPQGLPAGGGTSTQKVHPRKTWVH